MEFATKRLRKSWRGVLFAPILNRQPNPGALNLFEIVRVAGHDGPVSPHRDRHDKAIAKLDMRADFQ